jgi:uncharacterized RDD family membrane protein YckC
MTHDPVYGALPLGGPPTPASQEVSGRTAADESPYPTAGSPAAQVAVRARLNAIILDLILIGILTRILASALGNSVSAGTALLVFWALQFAYFFGLEARRGQTLGKRAFHVRVATLAGTTPTTRQIAVRNVLRMFDALPLLYASGLVSVMRTGPARRQRIGDVAAGTTVLLDSGGKPLRTPRWLLPAVTVLATLISLAVVIPALK